MNSGTNIKVAVRIRPLQDTEVKQGITQQKIECQESKGQIRIQMDEKVHKSFKFDYVFNETTEQQKFYQDCEIDLLLNQVLEGYHATIFAYGQTGSGKTYTMQGEQRQKNDMGIIPRTIQNLFDKITNQSSTRTYSVYCSYLQIYNERIFDLLGGVGKINAGPQGGIYIYLYINVQSKAGLKLRWNARDQFIVENLFLYSCKSQGEVMELFMQGNKNRVTSSHKLNLTSSRSHSILEMKIESVDLLNPDNVLISKLSLVDLAGSERINMTGAEGKQAKETIDINKSLFTLRQQITTKNPNIHAPYRESKLTSLLKHCIGGNSFCLMIACIVPGDIFMEENISTLAYASKATTITNIPQKNDDPKNKMIQELRDQVDELKEELNNANKHIEFLSSMVDPKDQKTKIDDMSHYHLEKNIESKLEALKNHLDDQNQGGSLDYESFSDRLVDSINMVRELLLSNKELRERGEKGQLNNEKLQRELVVMQKENYELRERLQSQQDEDRPYDGGVKQQILPVKKKTQSNQISSQKRQYQFNQDDIGFIPEQTTQFQRQSIFTNDSKADVPEINSSIKPQFTKDQLKKQQPQIRNSSQPHTFPLPKPVPNATKQHLPQIKYAQNQVSQSAAQQFFNEEESNPNYDELTNFGRRTLFQNGYQNSQQKFTNDERRFKIDQSFEQIQ